MIAEIVPKILPTIIQSPEVGFDPDNYTLERQGTQRNAPGMLKHFKEAEFLRRISSRYIYGISLNTHSRVVHSLIYNGPQC